MLVNLLVGFDELGAYSFVIRLGVGLKFEREFFWGADVLPEWAEEERRAVKYSLKRPNPAG